MCKEILNIIKLMLESFCKRDDTKKVERDKLYENIAHIINRVKYNRELIFDDGFVAELKEICPKVDTIAAKKARKHFRKFVDDIMKRNRGYEEYLDTKLEDDMIIDMEVFSEEVVYNPNADDPYKYCTQRYKKEHAFSQKEMDKYYNNIIKSIRK